MQNTCPTATADKGVRLALFGPSLGNGRGAFSGYQLRSMTSGDFASECVAAVTDSPTVEPSDAELIEAVLAGETERFEPLVKRYQARIFATARRYARREIEVEDIVQEVFLKAFKKLGSYRHEAPFEHWLMRLAVRTCYDFLRGHQRNREVSFTDFSDQESDWLERFAGDADAPPVSDPGVKELVHRVLNMLSPEARLVITLLEIEDRSVKEVAAVTGWSQTLVKVRAFRARRQMRGLLEKILKGQEL